MFGYKTPREAGGVTQAAYLYVAGVDSHFAAHRRPAPRSSLG